MRIYIYIHMCIYVYIYMYAMQCSAVQLRKVWRDALHCIAAQHCTALDQYSDVDINSIAGIGGIGRTQGKDGMAWHKWHGTAWQGMAWRDMNGIGGIRGTGISGTRSMAWHSMARMASVDKQLALLITGHALCKDINIIIKLQMIFF